MRWNGFWGSLLFGAFAALVYQPALLALGPLMGYRAAAAVYLIITAASYVAGLAPRARAGLLGSFGVGAVLTVGAALTRSPAMVALMAMVAVGFVRSAWFYTRAFGRALFVELAILSGAGALGGYLLGVGPLGGPLAVWGVFLVQSLYFLWTADGVQPGREGRAAPDPFVAAQQRALSLLDG